MIQLLINTFTFLDIYMDKCSRYLLLLLLLLN